jgi:hypothetical protein
VTLQWAKYTDFSLLVVDGFYVVIVDWLVGFSAGLLIGYLEFLLRHLCGLFVGFQI